MPQPAKTEEEYHRTFAKNLKYVREYRRISAPSASVKLGLEPYQLAAYEDTADSKNIPGTGDVDALWKFVEKAAELYIVSPGIFWRDNLAEMDPETLDTYRQDFGGNSYTLTGKETFAEIEELAFMAFQKKRASRGRYLGICKKAGLVDKFMDREIAGFVYIPPGE